MKGNAASKPTSTSQSSGISPGCWKCQSKTCGMVSCGLIPGELKPKLSSRFQSLAAQAERKKEKTLTKKRLWVS